jgi:hypothetical protein
MNLTKLMDSIFDETWEDATRVQSLDELLIETEKTIMSGHPLFSLGVGTDGEFWITEEERENHFHILGTTGEGKSKLLELMCRYDIDNDNPFLFLDSSAGGKTAYDVLRYCAFKKKKNVLYIDPEDLFKSKVIGLNPFVYFPSLENACVNNVADTIRVVFGEKPEDTPMISKYLPAILHVLFKANATLYEAIHFSEKDEPYSAAKRYEILGKSPVYDRYRKALINAYNPYQRITPTESTIRRFEPTFDDIVALPLAMNGIDYMKVVREKYSLIVNLGGINLLPEQRRLLGTLLINGIDFAVDRLRANGWKGVYYMYIDEAQEYATRKVGDILARKRKNGLRLIIAHHHLGQIEDQRLNSDLVNLTKTKIAFYIPDPNERLKVVKAFYGGDLADRDVNYVLGQQKKQHCVVKKGKETASIIKVPFVHEVEADTESYLSEIYQHPWYFSLKEIRDEINTRFPITERESVKPARGGNQPHHRPVTATHGNKTKHRPKSPQPVKEKESGSIQSNRNVDELFLAAEKLKGVK